MKVTEEMKPASLEENYAMNIYQTVTKILKVRNGDSRYRQLPVSITIMMKDFISQLGSIDVDPPHQRLDILNVKKSQSIISCILKGESIACPALCEKQDKTYYIWEVADGSHRIRAISNFRNGKIALPAGLIVNGNIIGGLRYSALPDELKDIFDNYPLTLQLFGNINSTEVGILFRNTNSATPVNEQEMRNSYGPNLVARLVRDIARGVDLESNDRRHPLFEHVNGDIEKPRVLGGKFTRLSQDQMVARMLYSIHANNGPVTCRDEDIDQFYRDFGNLENGVWKKNPHVHTQMIKKLSHMLDFVYDFAMERKNHRKNPMQLQLYICVYRYYLQLVKEFGHNNFKVRDWSIFVEKFLGNGKTGYDSLTRKPPITEYAKKNVGKEKDITRSKQFQIYAGHFDNQNDIRLSMEWLNHVIPTSEELGIIELDKKRSFSAKQTDELFADQGEICDVTGKKIPRSDAVAAHVIAHSKGGKTNRKNIVITGSSENRDMGIMSPKDYKLFQEFKKEKERKNVEKLFTHS